MENENESENQGRDVTATLSTPISPYKIEKGKGRATAKGKGQGQGKAQTQAQAQGQNHGPPPLPVVTYRHLLSAGTLNPTNPLRVVAHCDVDAAYAQYRIKWCPFNPSPRYLRTVEASRLGIDVYEKPVAVQQWNGLIAINYPARAYGISRHETIKEALKKCPDLILVHVATYAEGADKAEYNENPRPETHKVSLDPYRRESKKILAIFKETCPSGAVEKASIDESYFDLTLPVRELLLTRYPHLSKPPPDSPLGLDTPLPLPPPPIDWNGLGNLMPINGEKPASTSVSRHDRKMGAGAEQEGEGDGAAVSPVQREQGGQGAEPTPTLFAGPTSSAPSPTTCRHDFTSDHSGGPADDESDDITTWADVALSLGAELMSLVRSTVVSRLGYTTSAGIAPNKSLAKLCSGWKKPDAQTIMRPSATRNFLQDLPFQKIRFLGGKLGEAIAAEWESSTVGELWNVGLEEMQGRFGTESKWVWNLLRGIDHAEVKEKIANKTMLASKSVRPPIQRTSDALHWLSILSTELVLRLSEARASTPHLWPKTLVLRYVRAGEPARSRQVAFPFVKELDARGLMKVAEKLWNEALGDPMMGGKGGMGGVGKVVTIALGFSGLEAGEMGQKSIAGFFANAKGGTTRNATIMPKTGKAKAEEATPEQNGISPPDHSRPSRNATKRSSDADSDPNLQSAFSSGSGSKDDDEDERLKNGKRRKLKKKRTAFEAFFHPAPASASAPGNAPAHAEKGAPEGDKSKSSESSRPPLEGTTTRAEAGIDQLSSSSSSSRTAGVDQRAGEPDKHVERVCEEAVEAVEAGPGNDGDGDGDGDGDRDDKGRTENRTNTNADAISASNPSRICTRTSSRSRSWTCPQCSELISVSASLPDHSYSYSYTYEDEDEDEDGDGDDHEQDHERRLLDTKIQEHQDFHFAQSVQIAINGGGNANANANASASAHGSGTALASASASGNANANANASNHSNGNGNGNGNGNNNQKKPAQAKGQRALSSFFTRREG